MKEAASTPTTGNWKVPTLGPHWGEGESEMVKELIARDEQWKQ